MVQEGTVGPAVLEGPVVLERGGCSEPWKWEAFELWEDEALSDRGMAEMKGIAAGVAWGLGTGKKGLKLEEEKAES